MGMTKWPRDVPPTNRATLQGAAGSGAPSPNDCWAALVAALPHAGQPDAIPSKLESSFRDALSFRDLDLTRMYHDFADWCDRANLPAPELEANAKLRAAKE